jgi:catechol 2,3-dioxygenase-like lactoylglutathione lyase family enzyme
MTAKIKYHSTVIFVKDILKSKEFYTGFLDFSVEHDFGKNVILSNGLTLWEILPGHIINNQLTTKNESNRFELYFESDDIETKSEQLEKEGVKFLHLIHEEPWGQRTFRFFDPDNHLIEIGEPIEVFVRNMSRKGLTVSQISKKSGISPETIITLLSHPL